MSSNSETEAHKLGRETGEAIARAAGAEGASPKPKTTSDIIYDGVTDTANQLLDTTQQTYEQVKEAINPTPSPPPKTAVEKMGEAVDDATTMTREYVEGVKEAVEKATASENKKVWNLLGKV